MEKILTDEFIMNRVEEVCIEVLKKDSGYKEQGIIQALLIKQIQSLLPEGYKHLVMQLNDAANYQSAISELLMYRQGFKDCINIKK